ncbi:MAG: hypothetical protein U9Q91_04270 [Candidatus Marinimicrobia bacterium]|nr:hypothetical protein [Candidatus Neomarinimicrobiota bacterium]
MKRSSTFIITGLILVAIMLGSCFLLDNYELDVVVHKDGSYDFSYDGELNYVPALEAVIEGTFTEKIAGELKEIIEEMKESDEYESVKDLGKGKIKVQIEKSLDDGSDYYFLDKDFKFYSFVNNDEGEFTIAGFEVDEDGKKGLKNLNLKLKGKLTVQVEKGLKVKSHNADKKKKIDKKTMVYSWDLDLNSEKPEMLIKK